MTTLNKKKSGILLIGLCVILLLIIFGYFLFDKLQTAPVEIKAMDIDTKAALVLNQLKQLSKKNGITEWELNADSARLFKEEDKAVLDKVHVKFFTKDNKEVNLESKKGNLNTKSHDMTFSDQVIVTYEGAQLKTDQLQYHKKKHIITSVSSVLFEKDRSLIKGDSMLLDLNTNTIVLKGNVKGQFSESFKFY